MEVVQQLGVVVGMGLEKPGMVRYKVQISTRGELPLCFRGRAGNTIKGWDCEIKATEMLGR